MFQQSPSDYIYDGLAANICTADLSTGLADTFNRHHQFTRRAGLLERVAVLETAGGSAGGDDLLGRRLESFRADAPLVEG